MATKELTVTVTATPKWWFTPAWCVLFTVCRIRPSAIESAAAFLTKHAFNYRVA
jgi:hypothetical protein